MFVSAYRVIAPIQQMVTAIAIVSIIIMIINLRDVKLSHSYYMSSSLILTTCQAHYMSSSLILTTQ